MHFYECIPIPKCLYQLEAINKKYFISLILDNKFSMSNNFQIQGSVVARHRASFLLEFKNVLVFVQLFFITIYYFLFYKQTFHLQIWVEPE